MSKAIKNQVAILSKLGIEKLNPMQEEAQLAIESWNAVILLSPTGTGKTLAFLLPIIKALDRNSEEIQAVAKGREPESVVVFLLQGARCTNYQTDASYHDDQQVLGKHSLGNHSTRLKTYCPM